jgi:glyoxylase-like metal-dependent hydrolase (beta-lactamase superfamily II)
VDTPGHTADSVSLLVHRAVLTGDTVLGRGTAVVAEPDGSLADYLASLRRLRSLADEAALVTLLPGHGPAGADPRSVLDGYLAHRNERLAQVRTALAAGAADEEAVVDVVYRGLDPALRGAALQSVRAQVAYLRATG